MQQTAQKTAPKRLTALLFSLLLAVWLCAGALFPALPAYAADSFDWSGYLKKSADWYGTSEATALADQILSFQLSDGGWRKAMTDTSVTGSWGKSTTDNDATTSQITVLARVYAKTGTERYKTGCLRGIDLLLNGQYENGGWPQVFGDAGTYHAHITFNDGAMVRVLNIMQAVAAQSGDFAFLDADRAARAKTAVDKGVDCILKMQITSNGVKTAWCQQHDEFTLAPAPARAYELPSISASESVGVVNFLKALPNPGAEVVASINAAVAWMTAVQINGIKVVSTGDDKVVVEDASAGPIWARFYEIGTNKPMFVDRDGSVHDRLSELSQERRTGYAWYGSWPATLVKAGAVDNPNQEPIILNGTLLEKLTVADRANGADWSIATNLAVGDKVYGDRDFTFTALPDALMGAEWIRTACDSKTFAGDQGSFTATAAITVYAAVDTRLTATPAWLSDWTDTGTQCAMSNDVTFRVLTRDFSAGDTVTLGINSTSSGVVNYLVAVTAQSTTPPVGDINRDGVTDAADAALLQDYLLRRTDVLPDAAAADRSGDGVLDGTDLALLKQLLTNPAQ